MLLTLPARGILALTVISYSHCSNIIIMNRPYRGRGGGGLFACGRGRGRGNRNFHPNRNQPHHNNNNKNPQRRPNRMSLEDDTTIIEEISSPNPTSPSVRIAVEGCCHGELEAIYNRLQRHEQQAQAKQQQQQETENDNQNSKPYRPIDLLICCGDFQSLRNLADFHSLAVPPKYRAMGSFYKYYSGELTAPYLTIFVGGNHEASQPLHELSYGGWVAPRIYYMGAAGVVRYKGLRIGGVSGIYKRFDYTRGRTEQPPYDRSTNRSIYHVRNVDVYRLQSLQQQTKHEHAEQSSPLSSSSSSFLDVMISHDWPQGIAHHGDTQGLLRRKPYFRAEVEQDSLGSPPNKALLHALRPKWWLAAHLHVKFRATVVHDAQQAKMMLKRRNAQQDDAKQEEQPKAQSQSTHNTGSITDLIPSSAIQSTGTTPTSTPRKRKAAEHSDQEVEHTSSAAAESSMSDQPPPVELLSKIQDKAADADANTTVTNFVAPEQGNATPCNPQQMDLTEQMTQFLSLDKCLPRRHFLTIIDVPASQQGDAIDNSSSSSSQQQLEYDPEWLAILRKTHSLTSTKAETVTIPDELVTVDDSDLQWIRERFPSLEIPHNFVATVPPIPPGMPVHPLPHQLPPPYGPMGNPQTDHLLNLLELNHIVTVPYSGDANTNHDGDGMITDQHDNAQMAMTEPQTLEEAGDENEIDLDDLEDD